MSEDRDYLLDIQDAIGSLRGNAPASIFVAGLTEYPDAGEAVHHRLSADLSVIWEAAERLSVSLKGRHPEVPWDSLARIGQVLDRWPPIEPNIIWPMLQADLVRLADAIPALLEDVKE